MPLSNEEETALSAIHAAFVKAGLTADQKAQVGTLRRQIARPDLERELGLTRMHKQRERRLEAMTDRTKFNDDQKAAYAKMATEIERVYDLNYEQLIDSGLTEDEAKSSAMSVAKAAYAAQLKAIETEFGNDARMIDAAKKVVDSAAATSGIKF